MLFEVAGAPVHAFGVLVSLAFMAGGGALALNLQRLGIRPLLAPWVLAAAMLGGLIGARLHLALWHFDEVRADPLGFVTGGSGLVWYGGLLGGVLASAIPIRAFGVPWLRVADAAAPGLTLGLALGRIGCHLAGDGDWGPPTTLPWALAYPDAIAGWPHPPGVRVHPAMLYEMAGLLVLTVILWRLIGRLRPDGAVFFFYLASAALLRFGVEFVRVNPTLALGLSEAQWTSVGLMALASAWLLRNAREAATTPAPRARGPRRRAKRSARRRKRR